MGKEVCDCRWHSLKTAAALLAVLALLCMSELAVAETATSDAVTAALDQARRDLEINTLLERRASAHLEALRRSHPADSEMLID